MRKSSKTSAKELREELHILENKSKLYEKNLKCFEDYFRFRLRLEEIYEIKSNGVKIWSKCDEYVMNMEKGLLNPLKILRKVVSFRIRS